MSSNCRKRGPAAGDDAAFTSPSLVVVEEFCDRGSLADLAAACEGVPDGPSLVAIPSRKGGDEVPRSKMLGAKIQASGGRHSPLSCRKASNQAMGASFLCFSRTFFILAGRPTKKVLFSTHRVGHFIHSFQTTRNTDLINCSLPMGRTDNRSPVCVLSKLVYYASQLTLFAETVVTAFFVLVSFA